MTVTLAPMGHVAPFVLSNGCGTAQGTSCAKDKLPIPILTIRAATAANSDEVFGLSMIPKNVKD